ncbi:hypothetical protein MRX96_046257 [Rhipicephalus microplus]
MPAHATDFASLHGRTWKATRNTAATTPTFWERLPALFRNAGGGLLHMAGNGIYKRLALFHGRLAELYLSDQHPSGPRDCVNYLR